MSAPLLRALWVAGVIFSFACMAAVPLVVLRDLETAATVYEAPPAPVAPSPDGLRPTVHSRLASLARVRVERVNPHYYWPMLTECDHATADQTLEYEKLILNVARRYSVDPQNVPGIVARVWWCNNTEDVTMGEHGNMSHRGLSCLKILKALNALPRKGSGTLEERAEVCSRRIARRNGAFANQ